MLGHPSSYNTKTLQYPAGPATNTNVQSIYLLKTSKIGPRFALIELGPVAASFSFPWERVGIGTGVLTIANNNTTAAHFM